MAILGAPSQLSSHGPGDLSAAVQDIAKVQCLVGVTHVQVQHSPGLLVCDPLVSWGALLSSSITRIHDLTPYTFKKLTESKDGLVCSEVMSVCVGRQKACRSRKQVCNYQPSHQAHLSAVWLWFQNLTIVGCGPETWWLGGRRADRLNLLIVWWMAE